MTVSPHPPHAEAFTGVVPVRRGVQSALTFGALLAAVIAWQFWPRTPRPGADASLDGLQHVASVEGEAGGCPERLVVHLRDWHLVPREPFDKDVRAEAGRELSKGELDRLYAEHLDAV